MDGVAPPALVLVTGATGYIGSHVIKRLLDDGYAVRASVRDVADRKRYEFLWSVSPGADEASGRLTFVGLNLTEEKGWAEAASGCAGVVHTAMHVFKSSGGVKVTDPHKTYVEPALKGVNFVLDACRKSGTVKRLVFTSSVTAVSYGYDGWRTKVFTPDTWNTTSSLKRGPYAYAKTLAEKRVHEFMKSPAENTTNMSFATVLPFAVMGPPLGKQPGDNDESSVLRLLDGNFPVLPPLSFGVVDVRDVAAIHALALRVPDAHGQRFIASARVCSIKEFVGFVLKNFPEYKSRVPSVVVPRSVILFYGRFALNGDVLDYLRANLNVFPKLDTSNVKNVLGFEFRDPEITVRDSAQWFIDHGKVKRPIKPKAKPKAKAEDGALAPVA